MTYPLAHLCDRWLSKIELSKTLKQQRFGCYADESYQFFNGPALHMFDQFRSDSKGMLGEQLQMPMFKMSVNRIFEAVALYGPALVQDYPQINVEAVKKPWAAPDDPYEAAKQRCAMYKQFLGNWIQVEGGKKAESRLAITEAIVKGMGLLWTEMYQPAGSDFAYPRSSFVSVDRLYVDPDATHAAGLQWIALRHVEPVHVVETKFKLKPGTLKGHMQSTDGQSAMFGQQEAQRGFGKSYDLIEYYDIYSKSGFGERLQKDSQTFKGEVDTEMFGDFCRIVVAKGVKYPLNLSPESLELETLDPLEATQWPIPFWMDNSWPYTPLGFIQDPNSVWPVGICKNGLGYLKFINWCLSFLADRIAGSANVYMAMQKHAAKDIRDQLVGQHGPVKIIELESAAGRNINEVISILSAPNAEYETWKMIEEASERFDKSTGLTDIMYAATGGMRTATEADVKQKMSSIRPDDMAATTDDFLSEVAKKELMALCWTANPDWLQRHLGPEATMDFFQYLTSSPPDAVVREFSYRVAAESVRRPNKASKRKDMVELMQQVMPGIMQFAMMGMTAPWNGAMVALGEAYDLETQGWMVPDFVPPEQQAAEDEKRKEEEKPEPQPGSMTDSALPQDY